MKKTKQKDCQFKNLTYLCIRFFAPKGAEHYFLIINLYITLCT